MLGDSRHWMRAGDQRRGRRISGLDAMPRYRNSSGAVIKITLRHHRCRRVDDTKAPYLLLLGIHYRLSYLVFRLEMT